MLILMHTFFNVRETRSAQEFKGQVQPIMTLEENSS